jgi:hypothetical protein
MAMSPHGRPARSRWWPGWSAWALWALAVLGLATVPWFDQLLRQARRPELTQLSASTIPYLLAVVIAATVGAVLLTLALSVTASGGGRRVRALWAGGPTRGELMKLLRAPRQQRSGIISALYADECLM